MINWKVFGKERSSPDPDTLPNFLEGTHETKPSIKIAGVMA
jgi:hypothetical protein